MASEIRVNSLSSRTGLSTVTFTDTGPIFSGITTFQDNSGFNVGTGGSIFSPASNTITLGTNNAERLRITADGDVGIGTDNTTTTGFTRTIRVKGSSTSSGVSGLFAESYGGTAWFGFYSGSSTTDTPALLYPFNGGLRIGTTNSVGTGGFSEKVRITSAGNIGVGYDSPSQKLVVKGTTSLMATNSTNQWMAYAYTDNTFRLNYNGAGADEVVITSAGNIGIGINNPAYELEVASSDTTTFNITAGGNTNLSRLFFSDDDTVARGYLNYDHQADSLLIGVAGAEKLRIDSSGRIAQGGKTPTNHGSPHLLLWGADTTLHLTSTGSTNNSSFTGIKFAVAGGSTGDYSKAGIFVQRQDSYNDLDMIFAFRSSNDATGVSVSDEKLRINSDGHVLPGANNTYDLGSTAKGWRNVYMNDLNLSNMNGDTNDVDGTQGSWTIQEGKDDLYIINRLNGKKFKIKMEEIS
jgi:hypothetical protein